MRSHVGGAVALGLSLVVSSSMAETAAPTSGDGTPATATPQAPTAPPATVPQDDTVLLKDGTRYRGVIIESVPNEHVLIKLDADLVREVATEEVVYAGPTAEAPRWSSTGQAPPWPAPPPPLAMPSVRPGEAWVTFLSQTPGLAVWVLAVTHDEASPSNGNYVRLCDAPCSSSLPLGSYRLALSRERSALMKTEQVIHVNQARGATFQVDLESRRHTRVGGWVILGMGAAVGLASLAAATSERGSKKDTLLYAGAAGLAVGVLFGIPLGLSSDVPVVLAAGSVQSATLKASPFAALNGVTLRGRF